jgi:hypothetical protein
MHCGGNYEYYFLFYYILFNNYNIIRNRLKKILFRGNIRSGEIDKDCPGYKKKCTRVEGVRIHLIYILADGKP